MIVRQINKDGNYLGEHECQRCPETGGWLYPSYFTEVEYPELGEYEKTFFNVELGEWVITTTDFGKTIYDITNYLNSTTCEADDVPEGATLEIPIENYPNMWNSETLKWELDLETHRVNVLASVASGFTNELLTGTFTSTSLGIEVDCRRSSKNNDKQNAEGVISYLTRNELTEITYVGYTTSTIATLAQLQALVYEMEDYFLMLYNVKWELESVVASAENVETLDAVSWTVPVVEETVEEE